MVSDGANKIVMASTFPKLKNSYSWKTSPVSKEEVVYVCVHSHGTEQNKTTYGVATKRMNFICPVIETSKSIEPSGNALGLNAIPLAFSKIFQPELKLFLWWSWTPCLHLFGPLRGEQGNWKKKHFLCRGRLHSLLMACRNTKTHREGETKGTNQQWSKAFVGKHCQNKTSKPD